MVLDLEGFSREYFELSRWLYELERYPNVKNIKKCRAIRIALESIKYKTDKKCMKYKGRYKRLVD